MAILAIFTGTMSQTQYDALRKEVDWEHQQPKGGIFHAASFDEQGQIHVADVWESPDTLNQFVERRLSAAMQKLALTPPNVEVYPVHNINAYATIKRYQI